MPPVPNERFSYDMECKGAVFYNAFFQTPEQAGGLFRHPRPTATNNWHITNLQQWGWQIRYYVSAVSRNLGAPGLSAESGSTSYGVARALRQLGKSDKDRQDGGRISVIHVYHGNPELGVSIDQQTYTRPGEVARRYTGAQYIYGFSTVDGTIVNLNIRSPAHAARQRNPPVPDWQMPALRSLSDIQYAIWAAEFTTVNGINSLEWYFIASILNEETRQLIRGALIQAGHNGQELPLTPWPGLWVPGNSLTGLTLLGSPLGRTLAYFLIQHKPTLGNMWVDGVVIFHGDTSHRAPCLAFHVRLPGPRSLLPGDPDPQDFNRPWKPTEKPHYFIPDPRNPHGKRKMPGSSRGFNVSEMLRQQEEAGGDDEADWIFSQDGERVA